MGDGRTRRRLCLAFEGEDGKPLARRGDARGAGADLGG
jgi:hypothetical protein